ncbi:hypothetical protein CFBP6762_00258 [Xanthomonas arboricola pv. fragariae]|nr:hypothetical protein CFBP6762_00258 [Xanthomonas arboricola pv. fragariae]
MCLDGVPGFGRAPARVGNVHAVCSEGPGRDDVAMQAALQAYVLPQDRWLRVRLRVCGSDLGSREPAPSLVAGNPIQHLSAWAGVGAHLCARALPVEPHRAQVRSYNNRGAVGSRSAWLTALPPAPTDALPAARCPGRPAQLPGQAGPAASGHLLASVGAHLCARALPGEPRRARVRSYNNRGAVGSRSAWLTALLPAPAGPAASGHLLAGVGAHLCARALPVEPHRARVRSYNNRGAVGSRSAWLTALLPAPTDAGPAARYPGRRARLPGPAGPAASGLRYPDSARRAVAAARWRPAPPTRPVRRRPD